MSTLLMALAVQRNGAGHVIALEHDERYASQTAALLSAYGVAHLVEIRCSPLIDTILDDDSYQWYDVAGLGLVGTIDLLLVDGPPARTGPMNRHPAIPVLLDHIGFDTIVILDDAHGGDEAEAVRLWCDRYGLAVSDRPVHVLGTAVLRSPQRTGAHR